MVVHHPKVSDRLLGKLQQFSEKPTNEDEVASAVEGEGEVALAEVVVVVVAAVVQEVECLVVVVEVVAVMGLRASMDLGDMYGHLTPPHPHKNPRPSILLQSDRTITSADHHARQTVTIGGR